MTPMVNFIPLFPVLSPSHGTGGTSISILQGHTQATTNKEEGKSAFTFDYIEYLAICSGIGEHANSISVLR